MSRRERVFPRWDIDEADWLDHDANRRFAIYRVGTLDHVDDVVLDKETGLVWERCPKTNKMVWDVAIAYAYSESRGRRKGWRLPTIEELLSLVDPTRNNPTLPNGHPFELIQMDDFYWSCTLGMTNPPAFAWGYQFGNGNTTNCDKAVPRHVWLVRGGYGHDYPH